MVEAILDTDIGSDVDDALALSLALVSPEIELLGVTTVYGPTPRRARIARALCMAARRSVAVLPGVGLPLLRERPVHILGIEGDGIDLTADELRPDEGHAVDFIIRTVRSRPHRLTLIAIGPLTNLAVAMILAPDIIGLIREVIFIGGVARLGANALVVPALEWNVRCDPEAAGVVFRSGAALTMLGMDVTRREETRMYDEHLTRLTSAESPLARLDGKLVEIYWRKTKPELRCMHDVVAVAYAIDRSLVVTRKLKVEIVAEGRLTQGFTLVTANGDPGPTAVGMDLNGDRIRPFFFERVCAPPPEVPP